MVEIVTSSIGMVRCLVFGVSCCVVLCCVICFVLIILEGATINRASMSGGWRALIGWGGEGPQSRNGYVLFTLLLFEGACYDYLLGLLVDTGGGVDSPL